VSTAWSGWRGRPRFASLTRTHARADKYLQSVKVPWVMRKAFIAVLANKKITTVCTYEPGVKVRRPRHGRRQYFPTPAPPHPPPQFTRTFSWGMAGSKTEFVTLGGKWMRHPNKPPHENVRGKGEVSRDGKTLTTWQQRCRDDELQVSGREVERRERVCGGGRERSAQEEEEGAAAIRLLWASASEASKKKKKWLLLLLLFYGRSGQNLGLSGGDPPNPPHSHASLGRPPEPIPLPRFARSPPRP
jgi:hypothetical protein